MIPEFKGFSNLTTLPLPSADKCRQASGRYGLFICYINLAGNILFQGVLCHASKKTNGLTGQDFLFNEVKI